MVEPLERPEGIRAKVTDHATIRSGPGAVAPRRHTVQYQAVSEKGLARPREDVPMALHEAIDPIAPPALSPALPSVGAGLERIIAGSRPCCHR